MNNDNRMRLGKMIKEARITKGWSLLVGITGRFTFQIRTQGRESDII
jgi:hypothetical protein